MGLQGTFCLENFKPYSDHEDQGRWEIGGTQTDGISLAQKAESAGSQPPAAVPAQQARPAESVWPRHATTVRSRAEFARIQPGWILANSAIHISRRRIS